MSTVKLTALAPEEVPIGSAVMLESQQPDDLTFYGRRYLKSGLIETDPTKFDTSIFTGKALSNDSVNPTGSSSYSVIYAEGLFVATNETITNAITTSLDGVTWTVRTNPTPDAMDAVAYGDGKFTMVGRDGAVALSDDGITWTLGGKWTNADLRAVAYGAGVWVVADGSGNIRTSTDGITWTDRGSLGSGVRQRGLKFHNGLFVAIVTSDTDRIYTSTDGITWSLGTYPPIFFNYIAGGNGIWVATNFSNSGVYTTDDPASGSWTLRSSANSGASNGLDFSDGYFWLVSTTLTELSFSKDGIEWEGFTASATDTSRGTAAGGGKAVIVARTEAISIDFSAFAGSTTAYSLEGDDQYIRIS